MGSRPFRTAIAIGVFAVMLLGGPAWAHDSGFGLARYQSDGALDQSFGSDGLVVVRSAQRSFVANAVTVQPDGKILMAGMDSDLANGSLSVALARYNGDGTPDPAFGNGGTTVTPVGSSGGQATALTLQPDGKILVAGTAYAHGATQDEFLVARYMPDGTIDGSFGTQGLAITHVGAGAAAAQSLALQADGQILVAGTAFCNGPTDDDFAVVRYLPDGVLDTGFGMHGTVTTDFTYGETGAGPSLDRLGGMVIQADRKILLAGFTRGDHQAFALARYTPDGSPDDSFGVRGKAQLAAQEPQVFAVNLQPGGGIVIAGSVGSANRTTAPFALARFQLDGSPDQSFGAGGVATTTLEGSRSGARAIVVQADGKLLAAGAKFGAPSAQGDAMPQSGFAIARHNVDGSIDASFGSGGVTATDIGDAGATPLSLAVQSDGKILAAGLVFFRVPATSPGGPLDSLQRMPALPVGIAIVGLVIVLGAIVRRRTIHAFRTSLRAVSRW